MNDYLLSINEKGAAQPGADGRIKASFWYLKRAFSLNLGGGREGEILDKAFT